MKRLTFAICWLLIICFSCTKEEPIVPDLDPDPTTNNFPTSIDAWTKYCGWHYGIGNIPQWGGWVREYQKNGFGLFIVDPSTDTIDQSLLETSFQSLSDLNTEIDFLHLVGGLGSARDTARVIDWMNFIENDNGQKWKDIVFEQSLKLTDIPNAEERVFWQIGNEISSPAYSRTLRYWQGEPYGNGLNYDTFIIPIYVENFFAPTVEAIDAASLAKYCELGKINICLGSLTNALSDQAQSFLDDLLNYEIVGTNAPSLAGKKVSDFVNIITIHYTAGTSPTSSWESILDHYKNYTGTGRIEGVWSTEEVGIKTAQGGAGNVVGSLATFRYLEWGIINGYSSKEIRTNYFGWASGDPINSVNTFNQFLFDFVGESKLSNIPKTSTIINANNTIEYHAFATEDLSKKLLAVFSEKIKPPIDAQINSVVLTKEDWGLIENIEVYLYNKDGIISKSFNTVDTTEEVEITLDAPITLDNFSGLLVLIK